jgi:hypothetical protein
MKGITLAVVGAAAVFSSVALADTATKSTNSPVRLSDSECTKLWQEANPGGANGLTEAQSARYISNFNAANPDGDTTIDATEWNTACQNGLVRSTSSSGASSGESGVAPNPSEHAPTNRMDKMVPPMVPPAEQYNFQFRF